MSDTEADVDTPGEPRMGFLEKLQMFGDMVDLLSTKLEEKQSECDKERALKLSAFQEIKRLQEQIRKLYAGSGDVSPSSENSTIPEEVTQEVQDNTQT
jgi:hypothetical protein